MDYSMTQIADQTRLERLLRMVCALCWYLRADGAKVANFQDVLNVAERSAGINSLSTQESVRSLLQEYMSEGSDVYCGEIRSMLRRCPQTTLARLAPAFQEVLRRTDVERSPRRWTALGLFHDLAKVALDHPKPIEEVVPPQQCAEVIPVQIEVNDIEESGVIGRINVGSSTITTEAEVPAVSWSVAQRTIEELRSQIDALNIHAAKESALGNTESAAAEWEDGIRACLQYLRDSEDPSNARTSKAIGKMLYEQLTSLGGLKYAFSETEVPDYYMRGLEICRCEALATKPYAAQRAVAFAINEIAEFEDEEDNYEKVREIYRLTIAVFRAAIPANEARCAELRALLGDSGSIALAEWNVELDDLTDPEQNCRSYAAVFLEQFADLLQKEGEKEEALAALKECIQLTINLECMKSEWWFCQVVDMQFKVVDLECDLEKWGSARLSADKLIEFVKSPPISVDKIKISRKLGDAIELAGSICLEFDDLENAARRFEEALAIYRSIVLEHDETHDRRSVYYCLERLAGVDSDCDRMDVSIGRYVEVLQLGRQLANEEGSLDGWLDLSNSFRQIGQLHVEMGRDDLALPYLTESLEIDRKLNCEFEGDDGQERVEEAMALIDQVEERLRLSGDSDSKESSNTLDPPSPPSH